MKGETYRHMEWKERHTDIQRWDERRDLQTDGMKGETYRQMG